MSVASFKLDEMDQTAILETTKRIDMNGDKCALIKIATTQKSFSFDTGSLGVVDIEWQNSEHPGEIWLYVQPGAMKITIQHPTLGTIRDFDFGTRLKKGKTYVMDLTSDEVNTFTVDYENNQILDIDIIPYDAKLYLNGVIQKLDSQGRISIPMSFGTHRYRVEANNYHPQESDIVINDKNNRQSLSVRLKQAFGYLNVDEPSGSLRGDVYVDDVRVGKLPVNLFPLKSGTHEVAVYKKLYFPYTQKIAMTDSATITIEPTFIPNYAEYEIIVDGDKDAKIFDDGEYLGDGRWKGYLEAGKHTIEAKKGSHTSVIEEINVVKDVPRKVSLSRPMPIYGALEVTTKPANAKVYIDGASKPIGTTTLIDNHILIGQHHIKIELAGHKTEEMDVEIKEGQTERIDKELIDFCDATIYSNPMANISIDGVAEGKTPLHVNRTAGNYKITLSAHGYSTKTMNLHLDGNTQDMTFKLQRNYTRPNEFYFTTGYNVIGMSALNFGMGFFAGNVNIEGDYLLGVSKSETIYWANTAEDIGSPTAVTYKPSGFSVKAGYGIRLHSRLRLTPQVGARFITLKESIEENTYSEREFAPKAKAASFSGGLRFSVAIAPCLNISVTPEYLVGISKSNGFKALSDVSSKIKGYAEGLNVNASLNLFF